MEYKGYTARVEFDNEAGIFHGEVQNLRDVVTFQGTSVDELRAEFKTSVDEYLAFCAELGQEPEKPYSGKFLLRMDPSLHRDFASAASRAGQSLNNWLIAVAEEAVRPPSLPVKQDVAVAQSCEVIFMHHEEKGKIDYGYWPKQSISGSNAAMGEVDQVQQKWCFKTNLTDPFFVDAKGTSHA